MGPPSDEKKSCGQKCNSGCLSFKKFLYDPNAPDPQARADEPNKTVTLYMGRTCSSWAKIGLFYLIFYGCLAGFFSAMLAVFLTTINDPSQGGPKLTQFIANQPGLSRLDANQKLGFPYDTNSSKAYIDHITKSLQGFDYDENKRNICNETGGYKGDIPCVFDWKNELGDCAKNNYGFDNNTPCFFIKINKVYDWIPKPTHDGGRYLTLKCDNDVKVYPEGFLLAAFPYRGQEKYMAPIVAIQVNLTSPETKVTVTCQLEGKDILVSESVVETRSFGKIRISDIQRS